MVPVYLNSIPLGPVRESENDDARKRVTKWARKQYPGQYQMEVRFAKEPADSQQFETGNSGRDAKILKIRLSW